MQKPVNPVCPACLLASEADQLSPCGTHRNLEKRDPALWVGEGNQPESVLLGAFLTQETHT